MKFSLWLMRFAVWLSCLAFAAAAAADQQSLQYKIVNQGTKASAMMLGLADENTAFILDKVEGNEPDGQDRPTWAELVNLTDFSSRSIPANSNPFCASGATLANGSWIVLGGNQAVGYGGAATPNGAIPYRDNDGRKVVRVMEPTDGDSTKLSWIDEPNSKTQMDSRRWYPGIETLSDGSVVIIGGATSGGFVNRNYPNVDPAYSTTNPNPTPGIWDQGGSNPSYEFWPPTGKPGPQLSKFMVSTSGLNMYPHTYLMPSGKLFMQANYSTTLWDYMKNVEYPLPDMPGRIVRVYPASGATAMKPLTPRNQYTPDILFCGGMYLHNDADWGNFGSPGVNMYKQKADPNCHSIIPEPKSKDKPEYISEGQLPEGRSMGQFIHLPDGTMVIVNGARNGVAGFGNTTWNKALGSDGKTNIFLEGFSQLPTYRPVLYNPEAPPNKRLSTSGIGSSKIPRLYHSSAILIPDGSVLVAGSNPHNDVTRNGTGTFKSLNKKNTYEGFNTEYKLETWYPAYFFKPRPQPQQVPEAITYGGPPFNVTVDGDYMNKNGEVNSLANRTRIWVIRPGFSTHAMNMGQRSLELERSYAVHDDASVTFIINPMPSNKNLFVPGPALFFVTVNGVPSHGKRVMLGKKDPGLVPLADSVGRGKGSAPLPAPAPNPKFAATKKAAAPGPENKADLSGGAIAGIVVAVVIVFILLLAGLIFLVRRANRGAALATQKPIPSTGIEGGLAALPAAGALPYGRYDQRMDESQAHMLTGSNDSLASFGGPELLSSDNPAPDYFASKHSAYDQDPSLDMLPSQYGMGPTEYSSSPLKTTAADASGPPIRTYAAGFEAMQLQTTPQKGKGAAYLEPETYPMTPMGVTSHSGIVGPRAMPRPWSTQSTKPSDIVDVYGQTD
ncbi:(methyl)glyoxal oxidase [Malassezia vespertilionis]|uniref:(methyl)glyoxal oxidase n=1 Tax=Malassezia vespertilionis TaxID=2020962 RepID=UPI0024B2521A|nr:(methyl)glyoxal oxidase [Malassezia vespertilionis]WFD06038.1 (methyl)glyoxal oxidase [Malassezia vespertilionis]